MKGRDGFEFRVSDTLVVPLRGRLLRLRVVSGNPQANALAAGKRLRVRAPDGNEREVRILDHSITGGNVSQAGLDRKREVDVIVSNEESEIDGEPIGLGRPAHGPVE